MNRHGTALLAFALAAAAHAQRVPTGDYHQHLFSPEVAALISPAAPQPPVKPITADELVGLLDAAGIENALVLSVAYLFGSPAREVADEHDKVRRENDWTSAQVARHPQRLRGFCGLNPLADYALTELARCSADPSLRYGLKLHFGNSQVDYRNPAHIARVREVFRAANGYGMAIIVHMRSSISRGLSYGAAEARLFLDELVPAAPDVPIQIAHLAGAGAPTDPLADAAIAVFAAAIERRDPRTARLYFDVTGTANGVTAERAQTVAAQIRRLGLERVLYGSDAAAAGNLPPREGWAAFRSLPLTTDEIAVIARNAPPYMR